MNALDPNTTARLDLLRAEFAVAEPFRHVVIEPFLTADLFARLAAEFPAFDAGDARNEMGAQGGKAVHTDVAALGPAFREFDALMQDPTFLRWVGTLTGIPSLLYDPQYVGGGTHENREGQELDPHVDFNYHPVTHTHRRLNLILFFNGDWQPEWGGCLQLHRNPWLPEQEDEIRTIVPAANRCVLFETTETSWHGFRRISSEASGSRRSLAVYFYTRERPAEHTAPTHGTIYVPRPIPEHLRPGHILTPDDVYELELLLNRRDQQIRFLYERELETSAVLDRILHARWFRILHRLRRLFP